jgi:myo-inositol 2-dehydrogenase/D-chiro-inositol 1-dehydrogenase
VTKPARVGLVGCGFIGGRHLGVLAERPEARVVAVADPVAGRAQAAARGTGARAYDGWAEMLAAEDQLDAVWVCVPPFAHGDLELELVRRGLPFFVEKPLSADSRTAERVAEAVAERGLVTAVGYHWRYLDTVRRARELVADNPARLAVGRWWDTMPPPAWWRRRDGSGGQVVEQATHLFDLVRVLMGEPDGVAAVASPVDAVAYPDADIDQVAAVTLRFASGAVATISATCILAGPHAIGLTLLCDGMAVDLSEEEMVVTTAAGREVVTARVDPFREEDVRFLRAVRDGGDGVLTPYAEALMTHRLTTAAAAGG